MNYVLTTSGLHKSYGLIKAVRNLNLQVPEGSVFGILGPNGSGKSTTLSMLMGILHADKGDFKWFGQEPSAKSRRRIGAVLEQPNFYPYLSAEKNLEVVCRIKECSTKRIPEVLERVNLLHRRDSKFSTFSTGMKARLALGATLVADPELLVLDEPTNGLDPQGIAEVRELISDIAADGKTIIMASHILDEVEKVCTHVAVIKNGVLLAQGDVSEILADTHQVELGGGDIQTLQQVVASYPTYSNSKLEGDRILVSLSEEPNPADLNRFLFEKGQALSHLVVRKKRLEETFLELTAEGQSSNN